MDVQPEIDVGPGNRTPVKQRVRKRGAGIKPRRIKANSGGYECRAAGDVRPEIASALISGIPTARQSPHINSTEARADERSIERAQV